MLSKVKKYKFVFLDESGLKKYNVEYGIKLFVNEKLETNLCGLFNSIKIKDVPSFLHDVIFAKRRSGRFGGFYKGPIHEIRPNEKDLILNENQLMISTGGSKSDVVEIIEFDLFKRISLEYAHKCIEAVTWYDLNEKGIVDKSWVLQIKKWIHEIELGLI